MRGSIASILAGMMCLAFPVFAHASAVQPDEAGGAARSPPAAADAGAEAFLRWAAGALKVVGADPAEGEGPGVGPLLDMIGPARIVALSEATHAESETLRFRNALFLALARERGYRVLAMESGVSEGAWLYGYVRGGREPLDLAVARGFSWQFDEHPSNRRLLRALREYNASAPASPVSLYGFDVPGSPGNTQAVRGADTALAEALAYLGRVDAEEYEAMRARVADFTGSNPREVFARYQGFGPADRDRLTSAIADLVGLLERRETAYTKATSPEAFSWGLRHAVGARQIDSMLRLISLEDGEMNLIEHHAYRDRAMAENIEWIRGREGLDARIMVFASRFHVAGAPVLVPGWSTKPDSQQAVTLGSHLRARYGERVVLIGNMLGRSAACALPGQPAAESLDGRLSALGVRSFVLDLRQAPPAVRAWLDRMHALADEMFSVNPAQAFDIIYYNQVEPPDCLP